MPKNDRRGSHRRLSIEHLEPRRVLSYAHSLALDFAADFNAGLPQNNPNGDWTYLGTDGTTSSLEVTNGQSSPPGPNTFGVGAGWADPTGVPSYARGGVFGFPASAMAGHGPNRIVWTAPPEVDLGGVQLTGFFTQAEFEPTRQMQLSIFKNNGTTPIVTVPANFDVQSTIVPLPTTQVAIDPGDTLTILVEGSGPLGNGVSTFSAWDVAIEEIDPEIDADFDGDYDVDGDDFLAWQTGFGMASGAVKADGDADDDLDVDGDDFLIWQSQFGNAINPGIDVYHPAAIIVQTTGVTLPDGTALDISGTQTQGLQEAFDYSAEQGWDLFVMPGTYSLSAHIDIEELQLRTFRLENVTLNFSSAVTDYGIRFDSTMMVDWYWNGGELNAPNATRGVLFQPRTPHPLDGPRFGTNGMVDSRLQFVIDIAAGTYPVTMNTLQATINNNTFHFSGVPVGGVQFIGSGFDTTNIFAAGRTDDPIPFDLFSTAGRVTVVPPPTDISSGLPAAVYTPDGQILDVTGTQTFGLQEAFDYAATDNVDVLVFGRGVRNAAPETGLSLYSLGARLQVPDLVGRTYRIYGVTFDYPVMGGTALAMGGMTDSDFEFTGQVVATRSDVGVLIQPVSAAITDSVIRVQTSVGSPSTGDTLVTLDPSVQNIENSEFYFHEANTAYYGISIRNPSAATYFRNNFLRTVHNHAYVHTAVQIGQNQTNSSRIINNTLEIRANTDGGSNHQAAVQIWGDANTVDLVAVGSGLVFGARFESGSNDNVLTLGTINAVVPYVDFGTNNSVSSNGAGSRGSAPGGASSLPNDPRDHDARARLAERKLDRTTTEERLPADGGTVPSDRVSSKPHHRLPFARRELARDLAFSALDASHLQTRHMVRFLPKE